MEITVRVGIGLLATGGDVGLLAAGLGGVDGDARLGELLACRGSAGAGTLVDERATRTGMFECAA